MAKITLQVSDEQLEQIKKEVEEMCGGIVTDPLQLIQTAFSDELMNVGAYLDIIFNGGGNSIGDVFGEYDHFYVED